MKNILTAKLFLLLCLLICSFSLSAADLDQDGIEDGIDNCQLISNSDQVDTDGDQLGDACDAYPQDNHSSLDQTKYFFLSPPESGILKLHLLGADDKYIYKITKEGEARINETEASKDYLPTIIDLSDIATFYGESVYGYQIDISLTNILMGYAHSWEITLDDEVILSGDCGQVDVTGCAEESRSLGKVYHATIIWDKDTDADDLYNLSDLDDDGDGVLDVHDAFPLDPSESLDTDSDGIGDVCDDDPDGDGIANLVFDLTPDDKNGDGSINNTDSVFGQDQFVI